MKSNTAKETFSWICQACQAVNSDPSGLCSGCGARIDREFIISQGLSRITAAADAAGPERAGPPLTVIAACVVMLAGYVMRLLGFEPEGAAMGGQLVELIVGGIVTVGFILAFFEGSALARTLYLLWTLVWPLLFLLTSPAETWRVWTIVPFSLVVFVPGLLLLLPPSSAWFRR
jgi:hypothetical protein